MTQPVQLTVSMLHCSCPEKCKDLLKNMYSNTETKYMQTQNFLAVTHLL